MKNYVRLFALLMCMVMVLSMVPAKADAVALEGKTMYQMKSIYEDDYGDYHFSNFNDLVGLCNMASQTSSGHFYCIYDSSASMTISQNLTIPNNVTVVMDSVTVTIPSGVTVAVEGFMVTNKLNISGTVNVAEYGDIGALEKININGQVNLLGWLSIYDGMHTDVNGFEKINFGEAGHLFAAPTLTSGKELVNLCAVAASAPDHVVYSPSVIETIGVGVPLTIPSNTYITFYEPAEIAGDLLIEGGLDAFASVYLNGQVTNLGFVNVNYDQGGRLTIGKPEAYVDANQYHSGGLTVCGEELSSPDTALYGISSADFDYLYFDDNYIPSWNMSGYKNNPTFHEHSYVAVGYVAPTCLDYGQSETIFCSDCGEVLLEGEKLAPLGHFYGLNEKGDSDCWNPECLTCGALRVINPDHLTASMYRMYNPNSGEHFYTGSLEERQVLEAAGWKYEGVGFTICANTGDPVYRLYEPVSGEHLYTMNVAERDELVAKGWNLEGVAFNSCPNKDVPQYRLFNPNADIGAYHFTASLEERNNLLNAGWQDQGIGFYSCWQ